MNNKKTESADSSNVIRTDIRVIGKNGITETIHSEFNNGEWVITNRASETNRNRLRNLMQQATDEIDRLVMAEQTGQSPHILLSASILVRVDGNIYKYDIDGLFHRRIEIPVHLGGSERDRLICIIESLIGYSMKRT